VNSTEHLNTGKVKKLETKGGKGGVSGLNTYRQRKKKKFFKNKRVKNSLKAKQIAGKIECMLRNLKF